MAYFYKSVLLLAACLLVAEVSGFHPIFGWTDGWMDKWMDERQDGLMDVINPIREIENRPSDTWKISNVCFCMHSFFLSFSSIYFTYTFRKNLSMSISTHHWFFGRV